ncbi:hypothetical protein [Microbacterium sp. P03]|uniref:hypothetical protein n=1 Tax=Microbacterium sp. P03 TaxID=3366946 RepID=UPI003746FFE8
MVHFDLPSSRKRGKARALTWIASFVAFPVAGVAASAAVGRVDSTGDALLGGAIVGLVVGAAQAFASWRRLSLVRWTLATSSGMALGLAAGTLTVGFATTLPALATVGSLSGAVVGAAQALALPRQLGWARLLWIPASVTIWTSGWTVTTLAGVRVDEQFAVFGATGALVATLLSGGFLMLIEHVSTRMSVARATVGPSTGGAAS